MPFIANNGQMDEQVRFYAKTFGGTVFVTKEGEIVYALPEGRGRDVPAGASPPSPSQQAYGDALGSGGAWAQGRKTVFGWYGHAPLAHADAECVAANTYLPFLRADNACCPPERVLANALLDAYLPGLQKKTTQRVVSTSPMSNPGVLPANNNPHSAIQNPQSSLRGVALKEHQVGVKIGGITGEQPAVTTVNYFTGNDKSKWKTNVPTYNMVNLGAVYEGIELSLKAYGDNVEKLFCVKPGASPACIKVQLDGSKSLRVNHDGQLEADTELGLVKFTRPIAYQEIDGKRVEVDVEYRLSNPKSEYGFTVASYDKTKDLIIDPLLTSTYLGGAGSGTGVDSGNSIVIASDGNIYIAGSTASSSFPVTTGAYDTFYNSGYLGDAFISKLSGDLTSLLAYTYLGGTEWDTVYSITTDSAGNIYVAGQTSSSDFPTTAGAFDVSYNSYYDAFVSKLNGNLTSLLASTYLGGNDTTGGGSIAISPSGDIYVGGWTYSSNFPTTTGAYDNTPNGLWDTFVVKFDGALISLLASTYLGGSSAESGRSIVIDNGGIYVAGETNSLNFPTTTGAYDTSLNGDYDAFVVKFDGALTSLLASTYLGGSSGDGWGINSIVRDIRWKYVYCWLY